MVRRYENGDNILEFDGLGAMVGFEQAISETTSLTALVGVDSANFDADNVEDETVVVADIALVRELETIRMLPFSRISVEGPGSGCLRNTRDPLRPAVREFQLFVITSI